MPPRGSFQRPDLVPRTRTMNILVLNAGSSTLKFQLVRTDRERLAENRDEKLARGVVERIGGEGIFTMGVDGAPSVTGTAPLRDHRAAVDFVIGWLVGEESGAPISSVAEIQAAGHRVVHGGKRYVRSVPIDEHVMPVLEATTELAP